MMQASNITKHYGGLRAFVPEGAVEATGEVGVADAVGIGLAVGVGVGSTPSPWPSRPSRYGLSCEAV